MTETHEIRADRSDERVLLAKQEGRVAGQLELAIARDSTGTFRSVFFQDHGDPVLDGKRAADGEALGFIRVGREIDVSHWAEAGDERLMIRPRVVVVIG